LDCPSGPPSHCCGCWRCGGALGLAFDYFNLSWSGLAASLFLLAMAIFGIYSRVRVYEGPDEPTIDRDTLTPLVADFLQAPRGRGLLISAWDDRLLLGTAPLRRE
jgi:hypothetical protein